MVVHNNIRSYPSFNELGTAAADNVVNLANKAIKDRGIFRIALAGGSTPRGLYEVLSSKKYIDKTHWPSWMVYFSDERVVPPSDDRSNYAMANESLLSRAPIPKDNIYVPPVQLNEPKVVATEYEAIIRSSFNNINTTPSLDLVLLGLGSDGHTASLFPGKPALAVEDRLVVESSPGILPPPVDRITFTLPFINAARHVIFLASGEDKCSAFEAAYKGTASGQVKSVPAYLVRPEKGELHWFVTDELNNHMVK